MRPITFPQVNRTFGAPGGEERRVYPLVAHVDPSIPLVVECWRPTWRERLSVLAFGRVWISFLAERPQPISVNGARTVFVDPPPATGGGSNG